MAQLQREHRVTWSGAGWSCACGAGREWPAAVPEARARAAALRHQSSQWSRILADLTEADDAEGGRA